MWERGAQEQGLCLQTPEPLPDQLQNCSWSGKKKRVSHLLDMEEGGGVGMLSAGPSHTHRHIRMIPACPGLPKTVSQEPLSPAQAKVAGHPTTQTA